MRCSHSGSRISCRLRSLALALALFPVGVPAIAATRLVPAGDPDDLPRPSIRVLDAAADRLVLELELPALAVAAADPSDPGYQRLAIPGGGEEGNPGEPLLPCYTRLVAIPDEVGVTATATSLAWDDHAGLTPVLTPALGSDPAPPAPPAHDQIDPESGRWAPATAERGTTAGELVQIGPPAILRGQRVVAVRFRPVAFQPDNATTRVHSRIRLDLHFTGTDSRNPRPARAGAPRPETFDRVCQELVINHETGRKAASPTRGTWLLIAPNDPQVTSRLQPLIEWRKRSGTPVRLATTSETGSTAAQIRFYILNAYLNWPVPPEFVVLAGDASGTWQIPTWFETYSGYGGEGDQPYAQLDGEDVLADVHLGRLSFNTLGELETIVAKIVRYESAPHMDDPGWFQRACLTGDPNASGWSTVHVMQWIKTSLREYGYTQIDTIFGDPFVGQMQVALNRGDSIFAYRGYWGMSGWTNSLTYALTNGWKLPFSVISTCGTGSFAGETALSEGFLRAGTPSSPRGGIGAVGTATLGTHTRFNNNLTLGIVQGMLYEGTRHLGAALNRGKLELYLNYAGSDQAPYVDIFSHWNNLMGDPATVCWTTTPEPLTALHPPSLAVGDHALEVTVSDPAGPAGDATVCAWMEAGLGGPEVYLTALTDAQGRCELPVALARAGNLLLTVTRDDRRPYLATIPVVAQPLLVAYQAFAVDDDASGESAGNGDGQANPTEAVELRVQLKNFGSQPAAQVSALLLSEDPYVTVTDGAETFGDIPAGQSAWCGDDYGVSIAPGCPDGYRATLALEISTGAGQWRSLFTLPTVSARIDGLAVHLQDGGNGRLDPGETAEATLRIRNGGAVAATDAIAELESLSPWVTVLDSAGSYGTVAPGAEAENLADRFQLRASAHAFPGHQAGLRLVTRFNGGAIDTTTVWIELGERTSSDPAGPDRYGYCAFDDTDSAYDEAPAYAWVELDPAQGGAGLELSLGDYGHYQDKSTTVALPFPFRFYGEEFTHATICSNGWLALTPTWLTVYRNTSIPGAGAPSDMIAPFWDDLYQDGGSRLFHAYDPAGHRWIVEWSRFRNLEDGSLETFQAILLDPRFHATDTGDGAILLQYAEIADVDVVDGYATVGIQNHDHTDGLLYSYFQQPAPGAAPLAAGRAIRFQPVIAGPRGRIEGLVRNGSLGGVPLADAQVALDPGGRIFHTGADGSFTGGVAAGLYTIVARREGFAPDSATAVVVDEGGLVHLEFDLEDIEGPAVTSFSAPDHSSDPAGPYPVSAAATDPSGVAAVELVHRLDNGAWQTAPMIGDGDSWSGALPGAPAGATIEYYLLATDGAGRQSADPPGAPADLHALRVTTIAYTFAAEGPSDAGWTIGLPEDDAVRGLWVRADPVGSWFEGQLIQPEDDHTPEFGTRCLVTANVIPGGTDPEGDVDGGCTTVLSPVLDLGAAASAWIRYWRWFGEMGNSPDDALSIDLSNDGGATWVTLETVDGNDPAWRETTRRLDTLLPLTGQMRFRIRACDLGEPTQVEAALDDLAIEVFVPGPTSAVEDVLAGAHDALAPVRPNPFAGTTRIGYSTATAGDVRVRIHDVQGRVVRRLQEGFRAAGTHHATWDGRDGRGVAAPAGVYFVRLETAGFQAERKLLLVR